MDEQVIIKLQRGKKDGLSCLPVKIKGQPVLFMIDTGAYHSFVGLELLRRLGLAAAVAPNHPVMATMGRRHQDRIEGGATLQLEVVKGFIAKHDFCVSAVGTNILGTDFLRNYDGKV